MLTGLDDLYTETYFSPESDEDLEEAAEPEDADVPDADSSRQQGKASCLIVLKCQGF